MLQSRLVVTVAQAEGSLGREIAEQLAASLQLTYVDETVLRLATEKLNQLEIETYLQELAQNGRLLILGSGANFTLRNFPWAIDLLIIAPLQTRVRRTMRAYQVNRETALQRIQEADGRYNQYIRQFYRQDWTNQELYDLTLNTENLTVEQSVQSLTQFLQTVACVPHSQTIEALLTEDELEERYHKIVELLYQ